ncbi:hypothetical protein BaRGS_00024820 [Batillaria attramentaria]|uniref:Uncharacterized protein n=1 Tax=Batillaria attramentaria TaxID=370345 RepID=A0ABD0KAD1_9CAEN
MERLILVEGDFVTAFALTSFNIHLLRLKQNVGYVWSSFPFSSSYYSYLPLQSSSDAKERRVMRRDDAIVTCFPSCCFHDAELIEKRSAGFVRSNPQSALKLHSSIFLPVENGTAIKVRFQGQDS